MAPVLSKKWECFIPPGGPHHAGAAQFLENMRRYLATQNMPLPPLPDDLFHQLAVAFQRSLLHELVSVHVIPGPVGVVQVAKIAELSPGAALGPAALVDIEVTAQVRKTRPCLRPGSAVDRLAGVVARRRSVFDDVFAEFERDVVNIMRLAAAVMEVPRDQVRYQLHRAAHEIFKATQRGIGNVLIANTDTARALGLDPRGAVELLGAVADKRDRLTRAGMTSKRFQLYVDPAFPKDDLLMLHKAPSVLVTGFLFALHQFQFSPRGRIRVRSAMRLVNANYYRVLRIT